MTTTQFYTSTASSSNTRTHLGECQISNMKPEVLWDSTLFILLHAFPLFLKAYIILGLFLSKNVSLAL